MAIFLGFTLLLFVVYERTLHIEACYAIMRCKGSDVELDFRHHRGSRPIYTEWLFRSDNDVTKEIATKQSGFPNLKSLYQGRAFIKKNILNLAGISTDDSGIYTRKITDDSKDTSQDQEYTDEVNLTVMLPPSSKPILRQERTKNGTLMLICEPPTFLGYPKVKVGMKDSADNIQGPLSFTVNDTVYRCCLIGEATTCMENYVNEKSGCATYKITSYKSKEIKSTKDCNLKKSCFLHIGISWFITITIIKASGLIVLLITNSFSLYGSKKSFQAFVCNLHTLFECVFSLLIMITIMAFFCGDQKSCTLQDGVFILLGMASAFSMLIPAYQLASIELVTNEYIMYLGIRNIPYKDISVMVKKQCGIKIRDMVMKAMREIEPEGVEFRRRRRKTRRIYHSIGPNHVWHIDGYDKLKPYGFSVHGCIDGYSRKIMWLHVGPTNNDPAVVAYLFVKCVKRINEDRGGRDCLQQVDPKDLEFALNECTKPIRSGSELFDAWAARHFSVSGWKDAIDWQSAVRQYFDLR
ncbi:hypothetical protein KUTeg_006070 [Tegillarca granosa]|uniref:Integrase core domain-containing protein n=1 Tax=Tegillarca granosa TaxID=220873 RepID=A0ABQ9FFG3_TEGGR|nr:hypothetical protein KUTeg_006070 [Tegillarca granosa]